MTARRVDPMTATPDDGISENQANGIAELLGKLDRPYPPGGIDSLSFTGAGDLIAELRAEVLALPERTDR